MKVLENNKKENESLKVTITYYILNEKKRYLQLNFKGKTKYSFDGNTDLAWLLKTFREKYLREDIITQKNRSVER